MLPPLYERWLDGISRGEEDPPIGSVEYRRLGIEKRLEYISGLGFSEQLTESMKEQLLEDDEFERAIYHLIDGSAALGMKNAISALTDNAEELLSEASDALLAVLDSLEGEK